MNELWHVSEDATIEVFHPHHNELHAAGQTCPRCGTVIEPGQDVRLRADHQWVHEACPASP